MAVEIITIRHGETHFNREGKIQGSLDSPLTPRGEEESSLLAAHLGRCLGRVDAWFVSPQGRARQTSQILRKCASLELPEEEVDENLREIQCGFLEGLKEDEIDPVQLARIRGEADYPYPGGESILDVMQRAGDFIRSRLIPRLRSEFRAVIVSHGNFNRSFAAALTGLDSSFALRSLQSNTGLNRFVSRDGSKYKILTWNDTSHLLKK